MSAIKANEWEQMPVEHRKTLARGMTISQIVDLFSKCAPDASRGPRISREEWLALGEEGQKLLHPALQGWEIQILYAWLDEHEAHEKAREKAETVEGAKALASLLAFLALLIANAAIILFGTVCFGIIGFFGAILLGCFFSGAVLSLYGLIRS